MVNPLFDYGHRRALAGVSGCGSITGAAFAPTGLLAEHATTRHFFFADYNCGAIFHLTSDTGPAATVATALGSSSATSLAFDPFGVTQGPLLHELRLGRTAPPHPSTDHRQPRSGGRGVRHPPLRPPSPSPSPSPPPAAAMPTPATRSPTSGRLVTEHRRRAPPRLTIQHTYTGQASYTASLRVRDSASRVLEPRHGDRSGGNTAPVPTITSPGGRSDLRRRRDGDAHGLGHRRRGRQPSPRRPSRGPSSSTTGPIPTRSSGPTTGNNLAFTAPAPEDLAAAAYELPRGDPHRHRLQGRPRPPSVATSFPAR